MALARLAVISRTLNAPGEFAAGPGLVYLTSDGYPTTTALFKEGAYGADDDAIPAGVTEPFLFNTDSNHMFYNVGWPTSISSPAWREF